MIGNAHLDPVWLWDYREGFAEIKATFQSALDRLEEDPDFIFTSSSAAYYDWVEKNNPIMFGKIKERVKEGRWKIMGGMWIQPDCNLPSGESLVRQGLFGQKYFQEKFGKYCTTGYNVDSFGHSIILPKVLKGLGMDYYVFMRPMPNEKRLPNHLFKYSSRDGSFVKTFRILYEYLSCGGDIEFHIRRCFDQIGDNKEIMCFYGVGNHGGGPTKKNLETIHRLQESCDDMDVIFSDPEEFFTQASENENELPIVIDELQHHAVGCYSALSWVKEKNKKSEIKLFQTEAMASIVSVLDASFDYTSDVLEQAWKNVLFNQFHDILPGTSIKAAYTYVDQQYGEANSIAERLINNAIQRITWNVNIPMMEGTTPFVAINLSQYDDSQLIEAEVPLRAGSFILKDHEGKEIPVQSIKSEALVDRKIHPRGRIAFSDSIPSFGYKLYYLCPLEEAEKSITNKYTEFLLENEYLQVKIDERNGNVVEIIDKATGINHVDSEGIALNIYKDTTDTWSHNTMTLGEGKEHLRMTSIYVGEKGEVKNSVFVEYEWGKSIFRVEYSVTKGVPLLQGKLDYIYSEPQSLVKLEIPVNVNFPKITADMSFGTIERETNGFESFYHKYVDLEGLHKEQLGTTGISVITNSRYAYSAKGSLLSLMLIRNAYFANHEPMGVKDEQYVGLDEGRGSVEFSIYPHISGVRESKVLNYATQFNNRVFLQMETYHEGALHPKSSFVSVNDPMIAVSAIKVSEDNQAYIIRLAEHEGIHKTSELVWFDKHYGLQFTPFEVKTIKIDKQSNELKEVNFLENEYE